ncbi:MAG: H(+)/Cl(-) exchange transporter ClcA [Glaciecola sp. HTCC2999]|jgi:H+/Cl- antiporter ClcA|nr:MAG: H(+)/Cl(-) exchange transporter ClcA [Glaciecola sp. HTCC2999]
MNFYSAYSEIIIMLDALRTTLSYPKTSWQLCLLGVIAGVCAATVIIVFRLSFQYIQLQLLPELGAYEQLPWYQRFMLPFLGVLGIYLVAWMTGFEHFRLGIPFVIHRVKKHFGLMPLRTTINQFFGGIFALASGFFVGREGPSVHLGAAGTSFVGDGLKLPYNCIRILTGCGIAAGISASFNTPFAAVIFVMEVVMRNYRIHIFIPIMLSAAIGSVMSRLVFGEGTGLLFLSFEHLDNVIYFYLVLFGMALGALSSLFNQQLILVMKHAQRYSMISRFVLAAFITGGVGVFIPDAMGAEFNAVYNLLNQDISIGMVLGILVAKFVLALVAIGLGIPGGIIGPVMVIGMFSGALLAYPLETIMGSTEYHDGYVLLGVAGMLTAVLHAPLAAVSAVMELSYAPEILLPAILVVVPAYVVSNQVFKNRSIFIRQMEMQQLPYKQSAITQTLEKTGVLALCNRKVQTFDHYQTLEMIEYIKHHPTEYVIYRDNNEAPWHFVETNTQLEDQSSPFITSLLPVYSYQNTLAEVYDELKPIRSGAVIIKCHHEDKIYGIITWNALHNYLFKLEH